MFYFYFFKITTLKQKKLPMLPAQTISSSSDNLKIKVYVDRGDVTDELPSEYAFHTWKKLLRN